MDSGWYDHAAHVTRLARLTPAQPGPDLAYRIVAHLPGRERRPGRRRRLALGLAGVAQGGLGVLALFTTHETGHQGQHVFGAAIR